MSQFGLKCKKYRAISLKTKLEILAEVDKKAKSKTQVAMQFGIPKSTLSTIIKDREKIEQAHCDGMEMAMKKMRTAAHPKLEAALISWIKNLHAVNIPIDGNLLKTKAEDFALRMGIDGMKFSDGWVQNFKKRFNLSFKKLCGESAAADVQAANEWKENRLKRILADYKPEDIYNADETGLFYKVLPNRSLVFKNEKCSGGKLSKLRVTVLLTANMTGTDKRKLFVIGKSQKPRCFKGIKSLPVKYAANANAWMTEQLFLGWLQEFDRHMAGQKRNVLLLVDNCTAHPKPEGLTNVKVEFLPPNVTSLIQPMDQGIIQAFKQKYRKSLLQRMLINVENSMEYKPDLLKAVYLAAAAWDSLSSETVSNCFRHAGFHVSSTVSDVSDIPSSAVPEEETGNDLLEALRKKNADIPKDLQFSDLVEMDQYAASSEMLTDEEIVQKAMCATLKPIERESDDEDEDSELGLKDSPAARPTVSNATDALQVLRSFLEVESGTEHLLKMTIDIEKYVLASASLRLTQKKITDFLQS